MTVRGSTKSGASAVVSQFLARRVFGRSPDVLGGFGNSGSDQVFGRRKILNRRGRGERPQSALSWRQDPRSLSLDGASCGIVSRARRPRHIKRETHCTLRAAVTCTVLDRAMDWGSE